MTLSPRLVGVFMVALAACALALTVGRSDPKQRVRPVAYANGILSTSTSGDGDAILSASGFAPGHTAHGQVTVHNDSSSDGGVSLTQRLRSQTPGIGGGSLYDDLVLTIRQTGGNSDGLVYDGPVSAMGPTSLARFTGDERRTYSFAATMPDRGGSPSPTSGDNSLQDSSLAVDFVWSANSLAASAPRRCRHGKLGTAGADTLSSGEHGLRILGRGGDDQIRGGKAADCLYGGKGSDRLFGRAGNDALRGGYGDDVLRGGPGDDRLRGRQGDDVVVGGPGRDRLRGTSGNDVIDSADGASDRVRCGVGIDKAIADPADRLIGCEVVVFR